MYYEEKHIFISFAHFSIEAYCLCMRKKGKTKPGMSFGSFSDNMGIKEALLIGTNLKKVPLVEADLKKCSDLVKVRTAAQQTAATCVKHKDKPLSNAKYKT